MREISQQVVRELTVKKRRVSLTQASITNRIENAHENWQIACRSRCCGRLHRDRQSADSNTRMPELTPRYALALLPGRDLR
jgi:hypothetical protein